jgi:hypothetical protein
VHIVGHRSVDGDTFNDQRALARTAALLRGTEALVPRGVYRFASFEEADTWMTETIRRTHERLSHRTSSASAGR